VAQQLALVVLVVALTLPLAPRGVLAQEFDHGELNLLDDYEEYSEERFKTGYGLLQPITDAMQPYYGFKERLRDQAGFSYIVEDGLTFQGSSNKSGETTINNELNLIARLGGDLIEADWAGETSVLGWYQFSHTFGDTTTSRFQRKLGILSPLNGGDTAPDDENDLLQTLFVEQLLLDDRLRVAVGKLTTRTFMNLNRYAVSDREDFFSPMFVNNPVVLYTARLGVGAYAQYRSDDWYVTGMGRDANADPQDFVDWSNDGFEYALEPGLTPEFSEFGKGNYRFTYHYTESVNGTPADWDVSLSFDQDLGERFAALFRYAWSDEGLRTFQQRAALAMRWKKPFGFLYDGAGLGVWWGHPSRNDFNDEYGLEAFWVLQLSPFFELTPDVQVIFNRAGTSASSPAFVFGLRARVLL
jgi:porin